LDDGDFGLDGLSISDANSYLSFWTSIKTASLKLILSIGPTNAPFLNY